MNEGPAAQTPVHRTQPYIGPVVQPDRSIRPLRPFVPWLIALAIAYLALGLPRLFFGPDPRSVLGIVEFLDFVVSLALIVVGGLFFIHAGANADRLGAAGRTWGNHWGMLAWVIPVAHAVLPGFYLREVWRASDPRAGSDTWRRSGTPTWFYAWWGAWALANLLIVFHLVIGYVVQMWARVQSAAAPGSARATFPVWMEGILWASMAAFAVALPLFVKLVLALPERQENRARYVAARLQKEATAPFPAGENEVPTARSYAPGGGP